MEQNFETFFHTHERRIYYQMNRLNIPYHLHEEFYTEGLIALWKAYETFDPDQGNLGTYLNYRIRYRLLDHLRKRIRTDENNEKLLENTKVATDDGNRHRASGMPITDKQGIPLSKEPFWHEVKSHLTDNQWKWVKYFIIAELTIKEIMEIENVTADAVKGWGSRARKRLRDKDVIRRLKELL